MYLDGLQQTTLCGVDNAISYAGAEGAMKRKALHGLLDDIVKAQAAEGVQENGFISPSYI